MEIENDNQDPASALEAPPPACMQWVGCTAERDRTFLHLVQNALAEQPGLRTLPSGEIWTFTDRIHPLERETEQVEGGGRGTTLDQKPMAPASERLG
ncbi:hypothetical protein [Streptomyces sp. NPDC126514]|uniref:hypothetical protein n=1 Tax=Streptomyces sp. NPDC126514 TaxID=3155210 RepID=UPI0033184A34